MRRSGEGERADIYLEVRKRRGYIFLNETSACALLACRCSHTSSECVLGERGGGVNVHSFYPFLLSMCYIVVLVIVYTGVLKK